MRRSPVAVAPVPALVLAAVALAAMGGVAAWSVATAEHVAGFAALPAGAGVVLLATALVGGLGILVGPAAGLVVAGYAMSLLGSDAGVRADAAVVGPAIWLAVEASWWSFEARRPARLAPGLAVRRAATLVASAAGSGAVALVLLDLSTAGLGGGAVVKAAGVAAALAVVGLAAALARRRAAAAGL